MDPNTPGHTVLADANHFSPESLLISSSYHLPRHSCPFSAPFSCGYLRQNFLCDPTQTIFISNPEKTQQKLKRMVTAGSGSEEA
jgi:hypothetical protein